MEVTFFLLGVVEPFFCFPAPRPNGPACSPPKSTGTIGQPRHPPEFRVRFMKICVLAGLLGAWCLVVPCITGTGELYSTLE
jgi:hypothetical protein